MAMNDSVGIMHPAYFVGRAELLDWLNSTLQLRLTKVEETASGAVACQIFDVLFPGSVQMSRVNWGAKSEWEFVNNYKILQSTCDKVGVDKKIDVDRLIKARQQDNLEFLQWLKKFFDDNNNASALSDYDAPARRALGKGASTMKWCKSNTTGGAVGASALSPGKAPSSRPVRTAALSPRAPVTAVVQPPKRTEVPPSSRSVSAVEKENSGIMSTAGDQSTIVTSLKAEIDSYRTQIEAHRKESQERIMRLESQLKQCESERDYYFGKLKSVEMALRGPAPEDDETKLLVNTLSHILYEDGTTAEEDSTLKMS